MTNEGPRKSTTRTAKATAADRSAVSEAIPSDDRNASPIEVRWLVRALFTLTESVTAQTQVQREILEVLHVRLGADAPAALARVEVEAVPVLTSGTGPATPPAIPVTPHTASTPQSLQAGVVTTPMRPHLTPGVVVHAIGTGGVAPPPTRAVSSSELTAQPIRPIPAASHGATAPSNANVIVSPLVAPAS